MTALSPVGGGAGPAASDPIPVAPNVVDETGDPVADSATTLADAYARRAEIVLLATQGHQQQLQARLDRMRADFNATQEERSEHLREMNMLRDMAMEQAKHDDEILKKFIAMI